MKKKTKQPAPCPYCGNTVEQSDGPGRSRRFCDNICKTRYHRAANAEIMAKQAATLRALAAAADMLPSD